MKKNLSIVLVIVLVAILTVQCVIVNRIRQGKTHTLEETMEAWNNRNSGEKDTDDIEMTAAPEPTSVPVTEEPLEENATIGKPKENLAFVEGLTDLKEQAESVLAGYEGDWSVYVKDLSHDSYMEINSHAVRADVLMQLFVMGAAFSQVESSVVEKDATMDRLLYAMITAGDRASADELVRFISPDGTSYEEGMQAVNDFLQENGYRDTVQNVQLNPEPAEENAEQSGEEPDGSLENTTSVSDCGLFLERLYRGSCVSDQASQEMKKLLVVQPRAWERPLPADTSAQGGCQNDAVIVNSPGGDYIICVAASQVSDISAAREQLVTMFDLVYQYFNPPAEPSEIPEEQ